ncbi:MAG: autorepressor SdpR family transcription factor [Gemmatimonadota bacterium]
MRLDRTVRVLGDPTRRGILKALRSRDLRAGEIADMFPITAASISHHLNVLRDAGLVTSVRSGRHIVYSLNSTVFQETVQELLDFLRIGEEP